MKSKLTAIIDITKQLKYIFNKNQKRMCMLVFASMILCSLLELLGVTAIYPFIENSFSPTKELRVALLLPFYLDENKLPVEGEIQVDSVGVNVNDERFRLHGKSEQFVQFYEGFLLALDLFRCKPKVLALLTCLRAE